MIESRWPHLSLIPGQKGLPPCAASVVMNTTVPMVVRVPLPWKGPNGIPEVALEYEVSRGLLKVGTVVLLGTWLDIELCSPRYAKVLETTSVG